MNRVASAAYPSQNHFSAIKSFGILFFSVRFHAAQTKNGAQSIFGQPVFLGLALENVENVLNLPADYGLAQVNEQVGLSQISVVFRDLVFQNEFAPECIPC